MIKFKNNFRGYYTTLSLGEEYIVTTRYFGKITGSKACRFIKVTTKGFNLLDLETNRTILKTHLYMKGMQGKEYPKSGPIKGKFMVPEWVHIERFNKENIS